MTVVIRMPLTLFPKFIILLCRVTTPTGNTKQQRIETATDLPRDKHNSPREQFVSVLIRFSTLPRYDANGTLSYKLKGGQAQPLPDPPPDATNSPPRQVHLLYAGSGS